MRLAGERRNRPGSLAAVLGGAWIGALLFVAGCGEGAGFDIGNAMVGVEIKPIEDTNGGVVPAAPEFSWVQGTTAYMHLSQVEYELGRPCEETVEYAADISRVAVDMDSIVMLPAGYVLPPVPDMRVEGVAICAVEFLFANTFTHPTLHVNARTLTNQAALMVSSRVFNLRMQPEQPVSIPDGGMLQLELSVDLRGWFVGVSDWNRDVVPWLYAGGFEEDALVRSNIAASFHGDLIRMGAAKDIVRVPLAFWDDTSELVVHGDR